jgi:fructose-1,6-bisphosphatase/inositol monophosphatase family enzyme
VADVGGHGSEWEAELGAAIEAADEAGKLLREGFGRPTTERRKGAHDVVTALDHASERSIMARLADEFPTDRRLGEESGLSVPARRGGGGPIRTWIVDPLDGTINFASGIPFWCVSVALAVGQHVMVGVIADPLRNETYAAVRGRGAWRMKDGAPLAVRQLRRTADAVLAVDPGAVDDLDAEARIFELRPEVRAVRTLGSIALSLTSLATGSLDGVMQVRGLGAVDIAAAGLIAAEAGAHVTDASGGPWLIVDQPDHGTGIAAGRPGIHRLLVHSGRGELAVPVDRPESASSK